RAVLHEVQELDVVLAGAGNHGHGWVIRVYTVDLAGDVVYGLPDRWVCTLGLHLVADAPDENSRLVLILLDGGDGAVVLGPHGNRIGVVEAVAWRLHGQTGSNRDIASVRIAQKISCLKLVHAPGAN